MTQYFKKFPTINYNGSIAKNILARARFNENVQNFYAAFYPYTVQEGERFEHIAYSYYDDVNFEWLLYLTNDIIDPFYDVTLSDENFKAFIKKKYGTVRAAKRKIMFYRNNWSADDQVLTTSGYEALTTGQKKYWNPVISFDGLITGYERKPTDYIVTTNKNQSANLTTSNGTFTVGERIYHDSDANNFAFVTWSNSSVIDFQHINGSFSSNTNYTITGETSEATATVNAASLTTIKQVIPTAEESYFSAVYAYDYEDELNEKKKEILVLDKKYSQDIAKELKTVMGKK